MRRVYIFVSYNLYLVKQRFSHYFAEALRRQGIDVTIVDVFDEPMGAPLLQEIRDSRPDFTCSFHTIRPLKPGTKYYLWDYLGIPHWSILLDPSIYNFDLMASPLSILSCVDHNDCAFLRAYGFQKTFFWPHAVEADLVCSDISGERPYDIAFTGSCYDCDNLRAYWELHFPADYRRLLEEAIPRVLGDGYISLIQALAEAWNAHPPQGTELSFNEMFFTLDQYTRGYDRLQLVRDIATHLPVHVFGALYRSLASSVYGWEKYLADYPKAILHPAVVYDEVMNIMRKSKIYLNSMPFFKDGSHERILTALACGAVPVTSDSKWVRAEFVDDEDLLIYTAENRHTLPDRIAALLADEERRSAMVARGRRKVLQRHTWDQRAASLWEIMPALL